MNSFIRGRFGPAAVTVALVWAGLAGAQEDRRLPLVGKSGMFTDVVNASGVTHPHDLRHYMFEQAKGRVESTLDRRLNSGEIKTMVRGVVEKGGSATITEGAVVVSYSDKRTNEQNEQIIRNNGYIVQVRLLRVYEVSSTGQLYVHPITGRESTSHTPGAPRRWRGSAKFDYEFVIYGLAKGGGAGPAAGNPAVESKVWIHNQTRNDIHYRISRGGGGFERFTVKPGYHYWHATTASPPQFVVEFDHSFSDGSQMRRYALTPGSHNDFKVAGNGLDLYRR